MAGPKSIFDAVLQPTLDPSQLIKDVEKLEKDVGFNLSANLKNMGALEKKVSAIFSKSIQGGFAPKNLKGLRSTMLGIQKEMGVAQQRIATIQAQFENKMLDEKTKKQYKAEINLQKLRLSALEKRAKKEIKATQKIWKSRDKASKILQKEKEKEDKRSATEAAETFSGVVQSGFRSMKAADFGGLADLVKGFGKGAKEAGLKQAKAQAGGKGGGGISKMFGGLMRILGPVLIGLGALTGILAAVAAGMMGIDAISTKWTKSLGDAGVNIASLKTEGEDLRDTMDTMRKATTENWSWMKKWGVSGKDTADILAGFEKGGAPLAKMLDLTKKNTRAQEDLRGAMEKSLIYAKLFGMAAGEMSEKMGEYMADFGWNLKETALQFGGVYEASKASAFSTKRFIDVVLQATSAITMINVRFSETAGLLVELGRILGQKMAPEFLNQLAEGFDNRTITDNVEKGVKVGTKTWGKILTIQAEKNATIFMEKMKDKGL